MKIEILKVFGGEDMAVGIWRWHGDPAQASGVSASGQPVVPRLVCSVFEIEDDKIRDYRVFVDAVDVFTQFAQ